MLTNRLITVIIRLSLHNNEKFSVEVNTHAFVDYVSVSVFFKRFLESFLLIDIMIIKKLKL